MCLNPITAPTNKKYFLPGRWESFYNVYPCGQCEECRQNRQLDEYVRAQWMAKECLNIKGGYVIFDTLTYNDYNLPHVKDVLNDMEIRIPNYFVPNSLNMSCFRPSDWRLFLVRLRRYLAYHYGVTENCFNYLMASEYGSSKEYVDDEGVLRKATERPHYHVVFYVMVPSSVIDPVDFSNAVYLCWSMGNTDGVQCKGVKYFKEKRLFTMNDADSLAISVLNVIAYVSKYIGKQDQFESKFDSVMPDLFEYLWPETGVPFDKLFALKKLDYEKYKLVKRFFRSIRPFSRKGQQYGAYYLEWLKLPENEQEFKNICETGSIVMPMNKSQKVYRHSLPQYYSHKLFYEQYVNSEGYLRWRLNDLGFQFKKSQIKSSIDACVDNMEEFYQNRNNLVWDSGSFDKTCFERIMHAHDKRKRFFRAVAVWYMLYEGRIFDEAERSQFVHVDGMSLPDEDQMIDIIVENIRLKQDEELDKSILNHEIGDVVLYNGEKIWFNYRNQLALNKLGNAYISDVFMGSVDVGFKSCEDEYGRQIEASSLGYPVDSEILKSDMFPVLHVLKLDDFIHSPRLSHDRKMYLIDVRNFKFIYDKYRSQINAQKQERYEFVKEVAKSLEKIYKVKKI